MFVSKSAAFKNVELLKCFIHVSDEIDDDDVLIVGSSQRNNVMTTNDYDSGGLSNHVKNVYSEMNGDLEIDLTGDVESNGAINGVVKLRNQDIHQKNNGETFDRNKNILRLIVTEVKRPGKGGNYLLYLYICIFY